MSTTVLAIRIQNKEHKLKRKFWSFTFHTGRNRQKQQQQKENTNFSDLKFVF